MDIIKKDGQILTRIWINWNPCSNIAGRAAAPLENSLEVPQNVTHSITIWLLNSKPGIYRKGIVNKYSNKYMYTHIHSIIIHNSQKVEIAQMPISEWRNKQTVVYTHNGILFSHEKEWSTNARCKHAYWMNLENIMLSGRSRYKRSQTYDHIYQKCSE